MHVVLSKFRVINGMQDAVLDAFRLRPHQVDNEPGFIRMEVLRPQGCTDEFWLITTWQTEEYWHQWYHSHRYKLSHQGIPAGLKLDPSYTEIRHFELVAT